MGRKENRSQAREMAKQFGKQDAERYRKTLDAMNKPCTLSEAVQVARGVAEDISKDAVNGMYDQVQPVLVSTSLQIELIKRILIEHNIVTKDEFNSMLESDIKKFNEERKEFLKSKGVNPDEVPDVTMEDNTEVKSEGDNIPTTNMDAEVETKIEKREPTEN